MKINLGSILYFMGITFVCLFAAYDCRTIRDTNGTVKCEKKWWQILSSCPDSTSSSANDDTIMRLNETKPSLEVIEKPIEIKSNGSDLTLNQSFFEVDHSDGFDWYDANYGDNVQLKWARGCNFNGNDFDRVESSAEDCGGHCVADSKCTHFTYAYHESHVCYLKTASKSLKSSPFPGAVCGYMTRRNFDLNWQDGENGQVKWAQGCDFTGNDFRQVKSVAEECSGICMTDSRCTHFTYGDGGLCYLKTAPKSAEVFPVGRAMCGYITRSNSDFHWQDGDGGKVKYAHECDFFGNDIRHVKSRGEDCGGLCIADSKCTHFSWGWEGNCYLKMADRNAVANVVTWGGICGWVNGRDPEVEFTTGAFLRNAHGYCLSSEQNGNQNNNALIQGDCDQPQNGKYWSWDEEISGSSDRHLCNGHKKCVAAPADYKGNIALIQWEHLNENGQRFKFFDLNTTGIFMIKNDHGKCIGIKENSKDIMARAWVLDCNPSDNGQRWKWQPRNPEEPHPGYDWYDGESGKVKFAGGCDFPGNDFSCITSWPQHCGGHCVADSRCTHFSYMYQDGPICCLKTAPKSAGVSPHAHGNGGMCGQVLDPDSKLKYPPKPSK